MGSPERSEHLDIDFHETFGSEDLITQYYYRLDFQFLSIADYLARSVMQYSNTWSNADKNSRHKDSIGSMQSTSQYASAPGHTMLLVHQSPGSHNISQPTSVPRHTQSVSSTIFQPPKIYLLNISVHSLIPTIGAGSGIIKRKSHA